MRPRGKPKFSSKKLAKPMPKASHKMESRSSRWASPSSPQPVKSSRTGSASSVPTKMEASTWAPCGRCWRPR
eukprot:3182196-Pyramimonas_sp.AAC.1